MKREQESVAWLNEEGAKTLRSAGCSVSFQSWMNQWNCSKVNEVAHVLGKNLLIIGSENLMELS